MNQLYIAKPGNYYAIQMGSSGLRHLWFRRRQYITKELVKKYGNPGLILDIGCGNCLWNKEAIPTVGIDICENMLRYNIHAIPSFLPLKADILQGLPIRSESVNTVIITEVLEHLLFYPMLIEEINRVLKKDGVVIASVPYARIPGLWGIFFPLWCRYKGWRYKDQYYLNMCGHVVDFDIDKLRRAFNRFTFLEKKTLDLLTLFFIVKKKLYP